MCRRPENYRGGPEATDAAVACDTWTTGPQWAALTERFDSDERRQS
jgi:hypothetical protein